MRLPQLRKRERAILSAFLRLFDLQLFGFGCFIFLLGVWEGLQLVIVALCGLFSYFFEFAFVQSCLKWFLSNKMFL